MEENIYCVYMHMHIKTRKKYIGITKYQKNLNIRWHSGKGYKKQSKFYNAIKKYGWDTFKHEVLFDNLTKEQACNKEKALIKLFNTTNSKYGYNKSEGGGCPIITDKVRKNMSDAHKINIPLDMLVYQYITLNRSQRECADYFNCSVTVIIRILAENNIKKDFFMDSIDTQEFRHLYLDLDWTIKQLTNYYNCSEDTISRIIRMNNIYKYHYKPRYKDVIIKENLYEQYVNLGKSRNELTTYYNCSKATIDRLIKKYNIRKTSLQKEN